MDESPRAELQRDVQRLLGRCFLRLQQYEKLLKALIADHELAGPIQEVEAIQKKRIAKLAKKSLGQLVEELFDSYVVVEGEPARKDPLDKADPTVISFAFKASLPVTQQRGEELRSAIDDLVRMRNDLAHHFIDLFDLWSDDGCRAAAEHLIECYGRIDAYYEELRGWALSMVEARETFSAFLQSNEFSEFLFAEEAKK